MKKANCVYCRNDFEYPDDNPDQKACFECMNEIEEFYPDNFEEMCFTVYV